MSHKPFCIQFQTRKECELIDIDYRAKVKMLRVEFLLVIIELIIDETQWEWEIEKWESETGLQGQMSIEK